MVGCSGVPLSIGQELRVQEGRRTNTVNGSNEHAVADDVSADGQFNGRSVRTKCCIAKANLKDLPCIDAGSLVMMMSSCVL